MSAEAGSEARPHHLVALVGATASGKTAVAVELARRLPIEVVSADSRQIRRGMQIGTAAPTAEELAAVPHHLIGIVQPDEPWTLVDWLEAARIALDDIWSRGKLPLLLAGTGHYVWALLEGHEVPKVPPNPVLRAELEAFASQEGAGALYERLGTVDPESAARIDATNQRRVIRALEIIDATGEPVPPLRSQPPDFSWNAVGLRWPRAELYARADTRATAMYEAGLVEETRTLVNRYGHSFEALRSIGYAEALRVIDGTWTQEQAIERTQTATHRLIRMQATWFRDNDERICWVDARDSRAVGAAIEGVANAPVR